MAGQVTYDYQALHSGGLGPPHSRNAREYYKDATLFVTGMTGFVGKGACAPTSLGPGAALTGGRSRRVEAAGRPA